MIDAALSSREGLRMVGVKRSASIVEMIISVDVYRAKCKRRSRAITCTVQC